MKRVSAVLNTYIEEIERKQSDVWISMIYVCDNRNSGLSRSSAFLRIDQVCDLQVQG